MANGYKFRFYWGMANVHLNRFIGAMAKFFKLDYRGQWQIVIYFLFGEWQHSFK